MSQMYPDPGPEDPIDKQPTQSQAPLPNADYYTGTEPVNIKRKPDWQATLSRQTSDIQQGTVKWFYDAGNSIFVTLTITSIILSLVLILLGSPDRATLIAGLAVAIALPFNLIGIWLVQYLKDPAHKPATPARQRRVDATALIALSVGTIFTLLSLGAAFWRISWIATLIFLLVDILGLWLIFRVQAPEK